MTYAEAQSILEPQDQTHVLRFWDDLDSGQRARLLAQVDGLDFDALATMRSLLRPAPSDAGAEDLEPAPAISLAGAEREAARAAGEAALRAGRIGVILVAGGQGTRLGFDGPKGCFPIDPVCGASLFQMHARKIAALEKRCNAAIPFYIMTSPGNDRATRDFFEAHGCFGLARERVHFFTQGQWPALHADGRLVLDRPDHIFVSPDGHGGLIAALRRHGMLDDMSRRGLTDLFYFQVDNPLVEIADPAFVGLHRRRASEMSLKVCEKSDPREKVGIVARRGGRDAVVEYSELSPEQTQARLENGALKFRYGSVAIHLFALDFLTRMSRQSMPIHKAHKKVPYCDASGRRIEPEAPNAYKFEKFIFDLLPQAERTLNMEFDRADEFSPVKNATGPDSPATAQRDMMRKCARQKDAQRS